MTLDEVIQKHVEAILKEQKYNIKATAKILGVSRPYVYTIMKKGRKTSNVN